MKVLSALNNQQIQDSFKTSYPDLEFILPDISYQEGIIEALKTHVPDTILCNLDIEGDLAKECFIDTLRKSNDIVKIVLIAKSEDKEFSNWLIAKGIFDVFIDSQCSYNDIYEALTRELKVIIKKEIQKEYAVKEKVVTKEKIIKEVVSINFRKLILSIWGSVEFACELSYFIARLTQYKVLLIDLDGISPKADIYLGLTKAYENQARDHPDNSPLNDAIEYANQGTLDMKSFEKCSIKRKELSNMYLLTGKLQTDSINAAKEKGVSELIQQAYQAFDLVIISLNSSVYDLFSPSALLRSDYIIAAFQAAYDNLRDFENYLIYMKSKHNLPLDKIRYVAYEYKAKIHLPTSYIKEMFYGNSFLGIIPYTRQREAYKNISSCYARWAVKKHPEEYINILSKFNIVPRRTLRQKFRNWYSRKIKFIAASFPLVNKKSKNIKEADKIESANHT